MNKIKNIKLGSKKLTEICFQIYLELLKKLIEKNIHIIFTENITDHTCFHFTFYIAFLIPELFHFTITEKCWKERKRFNLNPF